MAAPIHTDVTLSRRSAILSLVEARPGLDSEEIAETLGLCPFEVSCTVSDLRREGLLEPCE